MTSPERAAGRPAGLTLIVALLVISAVLAAMVAIGVLLARGDAAFVAGTPISAGTWLVVGLVGLLLAAVDLLAARGLRRGQGWARGLAALAAGITLAGGLAGVVTFGGNLQWSSLLSVAAAILVLGGLRSTRAAAAGRSG